jgi:hypothetical protein
MPSDKTQIEVLSIPGPKRVNYFHGQVLSVDAFREEQEYFISKLRQQNRAIFNTGIIKGLKLTCSGNRISISRGFAMDAAGRLVEISATCNVDMPGNDGTWDIFLELTEEKSNPTRSTIENDTECKQVFCNIQEVTKIWIREMPSKKDESFTDSAIFLGCITATNDRYDIGKT